MVVDTLNVLSLCSGYGGIELGVHLATDGAARCVCYVEREASSAAILVKEMEAGHLAGAPVWDDLSTFDALEWRGVVDLITAGFPCQPSSISGKREGTDDPRWLWPLVARVIERTAAPFVFLENVPGLRTKGLQDVLEDLAAMGLDAEWGCLSAEALGSPQCRDRLWVLAYRDREQLREQSGRWGWSSGESPSQPGWDGEAMGNSHRARESQPEGVEPRERGRASDAGTSVGHGEGPLREPSRRKPGRTETEQSRSADASDGLAPWPPGPGVAPTEWPESEPFPAIRREKAGPSFGLGVSIRNLGNGVVPVVAAYAFRALVRRALGE